MRPPPPARACLRHAPVVEPDVFDIFIVDHISHHLSKLLSFRVRVFFSLPSVRDDEDLPSIEMAHAVIVRKLQGMSLFHRNSSRNSGSLTSFLPLSSFKSISSSFIFFSMASKRLPGVCALP